MADLFIDLPVAKKPRIEGENEARVSSDQECLVADEEGSAENVENTINAPRDTNDKPSTESILPASPKTASMSDMEFKIILDEDCQNDSLATAEEDQVPEEEPNTCIEPDYSFELSFFPTETLTELASYTWDTSMENQQYTKGCVWSPDGTCCLVGVNGDGMHLMELPQDLYAQDKLDSSRECSQLKSAVHIPEAGMVYDYCWYPFMNSNNPDSCL